MDLTIEHELIYNYSAPVYLEPQIIYLIPRSDAAHEVRDFQLHLSPEPSLLSKNIDAEGNAQFIAHLSDLTSELKVKSSFKVKSTLTNPFDFLVYPFESGTFPFEYTALQKKLLNPYLKTRGRSEAIGNYASEIQIETKNSMIDFLGLLVKKISTGFLYEFREKGSAMTPKSFFKKGKGTCRDYANFCIEICRICGLAARFVSGYFHGDPEQDRHLHGWVEVFLPGAGWRGIDPTQGVWVDEKYIPLAASAYPDKVAPVSGSYRGDAKARMEVAVNIHSASNI